MAGLAWPLRVNKISIGGGFNITFPLITGVGCLWGRVGGGFGGAGGEGVTPRFVYCAEPHTQTIIEAELHEGKQRPRSAWVFLARRGWRDWCGRW